MGAGVLTSPGPALGLVIVASTVAVTIAGVRLLRSRIGCAGDRDNEAAGFVYSMIGVIYAVLLAFIVSVVWQQHDEARGGAEQEALKVSNLLRDAGAFTDGAGERMRGHLLAYVRAVVQDEWPAMAAGRTSARAAEAYERVWQVYYAVEPVTEREKAVYASSIERLNELGASRQDRLLASRSGLPPVLWLLLVGGGIIAVGFTFVFRMESAGMHALLAATLAGFVAFLLFLIVALDYPFGGVLGIPADALESVLDAWESK
jgi:hypothetical protein